jgi:hypothetical protein
MFRIIQVIKQVTEDLGVDFQRKMDGHIFHHRECRSPKLARGRGFVVTLILEDGDAHCTSHAP